MNVSFYVDKVWYQWYCIISVAGGVGEGCCRHSDLMVGSVVHSVKSLMETLAQDEVQSWSTVGAVIMNNQINVAGSTTNSSVEATRPDLSVSC